MRIILYSGKGGVGKTSLSAATAVRSASLGHRTLVVSTDAAHSLADALDVPVKGTPTAIAPGLDALEIDVNEELAGHWGVIQEWLTRFMTFQGVNEAVAEEMAILPGMEELFSLLRVKRLSESKAYDVVVIDCAPTGETVRMLGVPEILNFYFKRIFPIQKTVLRSVRPVASRVTSMPLPSDEVLSAVKRIYDELEGMGPLLQDPRQSSIRIVLNPERMVINESQRLYTYLNLFGFPVDGVVANRVLPPEARSGYLQAWVAIQAGHLAEARRSFDPLPFFEARLFDREMVGLPLLEVFAREVFGEADPTAVFFEERPVEVKKEGKGYALYIRLPFAEKERIQVWTRGEELVVQVDNQRRHVLLPRTLAARRLLGAAFADQRLRVAFGEKEAHG
ncbi:MAG: arsenic-transporting ATPase [Acidobacteria bacterium]|nr:MAG: arsenic-transporting ATPase [Acidobacteriota bacterium]PYQ25363.1 MAG: arsenic-transporting ATPase [Acidobacteriota bacterium]